MILQLIKLLPEKYNIIRMGAESLPGGELPPAYPFCSFVVNIQVCSIGHRDPYDDLMCLVVPIGRFEGGQLCFYEPGLILDVDPGDVIIFPSSDITHFNLHFKGIRHSLVCQSDKAMRAWAERKNGWEPFINFS
jgi:hypothetical protein